MSRAPHQTKAVHPCGAHSRAFGADCVLPPGHDGACFTGHQHFTPVPDTELETTKRVAPSPRVNGLTLRQRQICWAIAQGMKNHEIAGALSLAPSTVGDHLKTLFSHFTVTRREQLLMKVLLAKRMTLGDLSAEVMP